MNKSKIRFAHQKLSVTSQTSTKLGSYLIRLEKNKIKFGSRHQTQHYLIARRMHIKKKIACFERLQPPQRELRLKRSIDFPIITTPLFLLSLMFPQHNLRPNVASVLISFFQFLSHQPMIQSPSDRATLGSLLPTIFQL